MTLWLATGGASTPQSLQPSRYSGRFISASASGASTKWAPAASHRSFFSTRTAMVPSRMVSLMARDVLEAGVRGRRAPAGADPLLELLGRAWQVLRRRLERLHLRWEEPRFLSLEAAEDLPAVADEEQALLGHRLAVLLQLAGLRRAQAAVVPVERNRRHPRPRRELPADEGRLRASAQAAADGTGDVLCPQTNRPASLNTPAADSRRFAPLKIGDTVTAEGNFETIDDVTFLSAHTSSIGVALPSAVTAGQPDYFTLAEVFMDAPAFYNQRYRTLIIGYTTLANPATDVLFWTIHRDKVNNAIHEVPWTSVLGCDAAGGAGSCSSQGLTGAGGNIFRIRHDIDFLLAADGTLDRRYGAARANLSPCAMLRGETRFDNTTEFCPNALTARPSNFPNLDARNDLGTGTLKEEFGIFSPIPHEIIGRTGRKVGRPGRLDPEHRRQRQRGDLGPVPLPVRRQPRRDLAAGVQRDRPQPDQHPQPLRGDPLEPRPAARPRRLQRAVRGGRPGNPYEYALDPFPYSGLHPKTALSQLVPIAGGVVQGLPTGTYNDPNFTSPALTDVQNRMFSFVNTSGVFNGDTTVIPNASFAPLIPPAFPIVETPPLPAPPPLPANAVTLTAVPCRDSTGRGQRHLHRVGLRRFRDLRVPVHGQGRSGRTVRDRPSVRAGAPPGSGTPRGSLRASTKSRCTHAASGPWLPWKRSTRSSTPSRFRPPPASA